MRRTPLRRKPWRRALGTPEQRLTFKLAVLDADGHQCVMSRGTPFSSPAMEDPSTGKTVIPARPPERRNAGCDGPLEAAHILRKHTLRKRGYGADVVYSPASAFTLCRAHHQLHDSYALRVPDALIPERCREFVKRIEADKLYERSTG
jgi:hypothetical protein